MGPESKRIIQAKAAPEKKLKLLGLTLEVIRSYTGRSNLYGNKSLYHVNVGGNSHHVYIPLKTT
jgi:hypothetical protein